MTASLIFDLKAGNIRRKRKNTTKPNWPWQESPSNFALGEESLWKAVLTQALMDATATCNKADLYYYKVEAMRWLNGNSADFQDVCIRAGFDPVIVRAAAKKAIGNPRVWQVESGLSERYKRRREVRMQKRIVRANARIENLHQGCLILHFYSGRTI